MEAVFLEKSLILINKMGIWLSDNTDTRVVVIKLVCLTPDLEIQCIEQLHIIWSGITYSLEVGS